MRKMREQQKYSFPSWQTVCLLVEIFMHMEPSDESRELNCLKPPTPASG